MQNTIKTDGKYLIVNGCAPIEFEEEIKRVLDMESVVVVLAGTFQGFTFLINPNNGRIIGTESWEK